MGSINLSHPVTSYFPQMLWTFTKSCLTKKPQLPHVVISSLGASVSVFTKVLPTFLMIFSLFVVLLSIFLILPQKTKLLVTVFLAPPQYPEECSCINSGYTQHLVKKLHFPTLWTLSDKFSNGYWVLDFFVWPTLVSNSGTEGKGGRKNFCKTIN